MTPLSAPIAFSHACCSDHMLRMLSFSGTHRVHLSAVAQIRCYHIRGTLAAFCIPAGVETVSIRGLRSGPGIFLQMRSLRNLKEGCVFVESESVCKAAKECHDSISDRWYRRQVLQRRYKPSHF